MTINTGDIELGPPIGTNTTGQQRKARFASDQHCIVANPSAMDAAWSVS